MDNNNVHESENEEVKKDHLEENVISRHHHEADDMPSSYRGQGPQENMSIGYDALEDI